MLDKMDERDEGTNEFSSDLFNTSNIDNLVLFQNVNEPHSSSNNDWSKITEEESSLWLLLSEWRLSYLYKTCIGKKTKSLM